jgi:ribonuclease P protein component
VGLPRQHRLTGRTSFTAVVRGGRRAGGRLVVVHLGPADPSPTAVEAADSQPRVGFIVSRAVGGSVVRHTVTRRLRPLIMARLGRVGPGATVVIRALPAAAGASSVALAGDLDRCLARLGAAA